MNPFSMKQFLFPVILLTALCSAACSEKKPAGPVEKERSPAQADLSDDAMDRVARAIRKHRLTKLPVECLTFLADETPGPGSLRIEVREKHGGKCGGDPATSPRLFTVEVDRKSGRIFTDANSADGSFRPLE